MLWRVVGILTLVAFIICVQTVQSSSDEPQFCILETPTFYISLNESDSWNDTTGFPPDCTGTDFVYGVDPSDNTWKCRADQAGAGSNWTFNAPIYNISDDVYLNMSLMNETMDQRDNDTTYSENSPYLNLTGTVFTFLEAVMNATITNIITGYNYFSSIANFTGTLTDDNICRYNTTSGGIDCDLDYSGWDTNSGDDFSGAWGDLSSVPAGFVDDVDNDTTYSALSEFNDDLGDRGYTVLTNFTDDLGNRGYTVLTNFTDDLGARGYTHLTNFTDDLGLSHLTNFTDDLGARGYTHLTNFTDDLGHVQDNTSWNESGASEVFQEDIGSDCAADNYAYGVQDDGTLMCRADQAGGGGGAGMFIDGGDYIYPNGSFADNLAVFGWIQANNWTNTTIGYSQINDLPTCSGTQKYTYDGATLSCAADVDTDTNVSTHCGGDSVMLGNESCINISGFYDDTDTQLSQENVEDYVGGMVSGTETRISVTYNDGTGNLDYVVDDMNDDQPDSDAEVPDDITLDTTKNVTTTEFYILPSNKKICFDGTGCSVYIIYNSTAQNLTFCNNC